MFGYVIPNQQELTEEQFKEYRGWYCGLCRKLKKEYGLAGQLSLNYDMTFLGLLLTSLYEPQVLSGQHRCVLHPIKERIEYSSKYLDYAADMNLLLVYYKCQDDWRDDKSFWKAGYGLVLTKKAKSITEKYPEKAECIQQCLERITEIEKRQSENMEEAANVFGELCAGLFLYHQDEWKSSLQKLGFYLGKFIFLMDAWDDLEKDRKRKEYNPFIQVEDDEKIYHILHMMMAEACKAFERLPIVENVEILRNILYSGVWCHYRQKEEKRKGKKDKKI